jgi:hypothetical protein
MDIKNKPKNAKIFVCETCDFKCCKQSNFAIHQTTAKHVRQTTGYKKDMGQEAKNALGPEFACECGKKYNYQSGLWRHKKKCNYVKPINENNIEILVKDSFDLKHLMLELMKSNTDLQKQMLEVCKTSNNSIIHNNSHNKTFNMQVFLNEQCKDAMNIMDFVNTFHFDFSDLERVGEVGYVEGMSNIIIQKLNEMDICKRPIHCSDVKRDTMYVKDKNVWEKENGNHDKLRLAIRYIGKKNTDLLNKWCEAHPGSCDSDNYLNDIYMEMVMQAMGGRGDREDNENKIMRKIARTVLIDKEHNFS